MHNPIFRRQLLATGAAVLLLAGCASTPAPVVNHSFGYGQAAQTPVPGTSAPSGAAGANGGVQTFGLGHANGSVSPGGYTVAPGDTLYSIAFAHGVDYRTLAARNSIPEPYTIHPGQVLKLQGEPAADSAAAMATVAATTPAPTTAPAPVAAPVTPPVQAAQPSAPVFGPVTAQTMTGTGVAPAESASTATGAASAATISVPVVPAAQPEPAPALPSQATRSVAGVTWQWPASGRVIGGFQSGAGGDAAGLDIAGNLGDPVRAAAAGTVVYSGDGLPGYGDLVIIKHNDSYLSAYGHNSKRLVKEGERVGAGQEIALMGASGAPRVELHFEIRKDGKPVDPMGYLPQR